MSAAKEGPNLFAVLVVEDEMLIAMELTAILEDAGFEVVGPAFNNDRALALVEEGGFKVCVLDVNLRGQLSTPVAEALTAQAIPFVLSSAYADELLEQHQAYRGRTNIGKPAPAGRLISALRSLVKETPTR